MPSREAGEIVPMLSTSAPMARLRSAASAASCDMMGEEEKASARLADMVDETCEVMVWISGGPCSALRWKASRLAADVLYHSTSPEGEEGKAKADAMP